MLVKCIEMMELSKTIEETSGTSILSDAWNNASIMLAEIGFLVNLVTAISVFATAFLLGGSMVMLVTLIISLVCLVAIGTKLRRRGFFYRIMNAQFDAQTKALWTNQNEYLARMIALFTNESREDNIARIETLEERLGITRDEPIHNGVEVGTDERN